MAAGELLFIPMRSLLALVPCCWNWHAEFPAWYPLRSCLPVSKKEYLQPRGINLNLLIYFNNKFLAFSLSFFICASNVIFNIIWLLLMQYVDVVPYVIIIFPLAYKKCCFFGPMHLQFVHWSPGGEILLWNCCITYHYTIWCINCNSIPFLLRVIICHVEYCRVELLFVKVVL